MIATVFLLLIGIIDPPEARWTAVCGGIKDDFAEAALEVHDKGLFVVGYSASFSTGDLDGWLGCFDAGDGDLEWEKTYGGSRDDRLHAILPAPDDCLYLIGETSSKGSGESDLWLLCVDQSGSLQWERTYGGEFEDVVLAASILPDGRIVSAGFTWSEGSGGADAWIVCFTAEGEIEWVRTLGGEKLEKAFDVAVSRDSTILITGVTYSNSASGNAFMAEYDRWGTKLWETVWGQDSNYDIGIVLCPLPNGSTISGCWTKRTTCGLNMVTLDEQGVVTDENFIATGMDLRIGTLDLMINEDMLIGGNTETLELGDKEIFVWKISSSGERIWNLIQGGSNDERCSDIIITSEGRAVIVGSSSSFGGGDWDIWVICLEGY